MPIFVSMGGITISGRREKEADHRLDRYDYLYKGGAAAALDSSYQRDTAAGGQGQSIFIPFFDRAIKRCYEIRRMISGPDGFKEVL
jgi:hypothetical protein